MLKVWLLPKRCSLGITIIAFALETTNPIFAADNTTNKTNVCARDVSNENALISAWVGFLRLFTNCGESLPPPPPPPAPADMAPLQVFFEFGSAKLEAEAQEAISLAARKGLQDHDKITIIGHTDTAESATLAGTLSERRAQAVKSELVHLGFDEGQITTLARGSSDPIVDTGPNIREPLNRRVNVERGH